MANYLNIVPFIRKVEGGLSKAKTDTASKDSLPDGTGYHTNKGITWTTMKGFQKALGIATIADLMKVFYAMPDAIWLKIYKYGYWDKVRGDEIKSQAIADTLVDWAWGAGPGRAVQKLQEFLKVPQTSKMDNATLQKLNSISDESAFLASFSAYKKNWYLTLKNQEPNYKGWAMRLDELYKISSKTIKEKPVATLGVGIAVVGISYLVYQAFRSNANQEVKQAA